MKIKHRIFLTVDVEGDWSLYPSEQKIFDSSIIEENLEFLDAVILSAEKKLKIDIPVTWFIRCDESVKVNLGSYGGLLSQLKGFITRKKQKGDDFGIHPHLYSFSKNRKDLSRDDIHDQFKKAFEAWQDFFGESPKFSRIGEARMCNIIAGEINQYGIEIDSTALPGRSRNDHGFNFDWRNTLNKSYRPSKKDYQISSSKKDRNLSFLEVPFSMVPSKSENDIDFFNRYLNLGFKSKSLEGSFEHLKNQEDIICIVHPHEINPNRAHIHPIISYSDVDFLANIKNLVNTLNNFSFHSFSSIRDRK